MHFVQHLLYGLSHDSIHPSDVVCEVILCKVLDSVGSARRNTLLDMIINVLKTCTPGVFPSTMILVFMVDNVTTVPCITAAQRWQTTGWCIVYVGGGSRAYRAHVAPVCRPSPTRTRAAYTGMHSGALEGG